MRLGIDGFDRPQAVANEDDALIAKGLLLKTETGLAFESPFTRGWTVLHALPDAGIVRRPF